MSYLILFGVLAFWVLFDGLSRQMKVTAIAWAIGTALLGPIVIPAYLAMRPLKTGEIREGGTPWNVLKNFALLWTIAMTVVGFIALKAASDQTTKLHSDAALAGAGLGMFLGFGVLIAVWFFPTLGAASLGFLLKKNSIVEVGPTGSMMGKHSKTSSFAGWGGIVGAAVVALFLISAADQTRANTNLPAARAANKSSMSIQSAKDTTESSEWQVTESHNEMDGTKEISLALDAQNEIEGFIGKNRPSLGIRCAKHKPEVYIQVGEPFESEYGEFNTTSVRIKFDEKPPVKQRWNESTNDEAAFSTNPTKLVRDLATTKTFLVEFTPFQKRPTTVTFKIGDLKKELEPAIDICGLDQRPQKGLSRLKGTINDANELRGRDIEIAEAVRAAKEAAHNAMSQESSHLTTTAP